MARRKTRTITRYVKSRSRRRSRYGGGGFKDMIDGGAAGLLGNFLTKYIGNYGIPAAALAVGYFRKNSVLKTEGSRELGLLIGSSLPFIGGSQTTIGGAY